MKVLLLFLTIFLCSEISAQKIPSTGNYTSADGYYTIVISYKDKVLTIVEPNKTSPYKYVSGNEYHFTNPTNGIEYLIEVVDETTLATYKPTNRSNKYFFYFTGTANTPASKEDFAKYFPIAEKYKEKMKEDPKDAQLWSFCAAAANARSSFSKEGYEEYLSKVVPSMKAILEKKDKCPCTDAIDQRLFDKF